VSDTSSSTRPPVAAIGIGASAGGLRPLRAIVGGLPADLPAAVFVVLHVAATGTSVLPEILARATPMEVFRAEDGLEVRPGRVIVAPPDRHLVVELRDGAVRPPRVRLTRGPRENGHRPAIDPLLRSLAAAFGDRAAGLILSGTRDDGTLGLAAVKHDGGAALVQDPADAEYASMPANAMGVTAVDAALPVAALAPALIALARGERLDAPAPNPGPAAPFSTNGEPLKITCPDCGGVLTEEDEAGVVRFRCHVGHTYSPRSLLALHADGVERAMWTAARGLEDRAVLLANLAERARGTGHARTADQFEGHARQARAESEAIRAAIAALDDDISADPLGNGGELA
jgi:two-component system, chemotaxis family, protein-glutamate methylesterase/glutaminase